MLLSVWVLAALGMGGMAQPPGPTPRPQDKAPTRPPFFQNQKPKMPVAAVWDLKEVEASFTILDRT